MNSSVRWIAAAAAVLLVAVVGFAFLGRASDTGVGGLAPASPSPSPSLSPAASPAAVFPDWLTEEQPPSAAGILPAGRNSPRSADYSFIVPAGWINTYDADGLYRLFPDSAANAAEFALSRGVAQDMHIGGIMDANGLALGCDGVDPAARGPEAAEIAGALSEAEGLSTTEPLPVTIGGLSGLQIDVRIDPDWTGTCALGPQDPPNLDFRDIRVRYIILDRPPAGNVLIVMNSLHATDFEPFLAEAMPIAESIEFDAAP